MPPSRVSTERIIQDFGQSLDFTNELVQNLLKDLQDSAIDFTQLRTELNNLISSFKELSQSLKSTDTRISDINLKFALMEQHIKQLENKLSEMDKDKKQHDLADKTGKWQMKVALTAGAISFITAIISILYQILK